MMPRVKEREEKTVVIQLLMVLKQYKQTAHSSESVGPYSYHVHFDTIWNVRPVSVNRKIQIPYSPTLMILVRRSEMPAAHH